MDDPQAVAAGRDRSLRGGREATATAKGGGPAEMGLALDVLRVTTTLLVVAYHAALAYLAVPLRLTLWFYDPSTHPAIDVFVYAVNVFAMPLFFLAAGIPAPAAVRSRGVNVFLRSRVDRLLRPLLFGILVLTPVCYFVWGVGLQLTGRISFENIASWEFDSGVEPHLYGIGHLWFLEYLFLVCAMWALGVWAFAKLRTRLALPDAGAENGWITRIIASPFRPVLIAIPTAVIFLVDTDTLLRIPNDVVPDPLRLLHYGYFFVVGGWLARLRQPKVQLTPWSGLYLTLGILLFAVMSPAMLKHAASPLVGMERVRYALLAAACPWFLVFGSLGVLVRVVQTRGPVLRYLAEASFWIYMAHLPVIGGMQILLLPLGWPAALKMLVVTAVALGASLASYELIVRYSVVAEIINGSRKRTSGTRRFSPERGWQAAAACLVLFYAVIIWYHGPLIWGANLHASVPGRLYRSGRLGFSKFESVLQQAKIRTVVTFGGGDHHAWYRRQAALGKARGVTTHTVALRSDRMPPRQVLQQLVELHDHCGAPFLMQGYRGTEESAFAVALCRLLDGASPAEALGEFSSRYGVTGGAPASLLGSVLLDYTEWLEAHAQTHSPDLVRNWVAHEYQVWRMPEVQPTVQLRIALSKPGGEGRR